MLAVCWLPGVAFGAAIGLRGWTLAGGAPAMTFGLAAIGVVVLDTLGIPWALLGFGSWVAAVTVLSLAGSWLWRRRRGRSSTPGPINHAASSRTWLDHVLIGGGVAAGLVVGAAAFLRGIGSMNALAQDADAPFAANLIRWIAEHHSALPSTVGAVAYRPDDPTFFYPDTYHAVLALLFDATGVGMPQLLNLGALAIVLMIPPSVAAITAAWRMPTLGVASAAAVSTWFTGFPYDSLVRGPLWPYLMGLALLPAVLAIARYVIAPRGMAGVVGVAMGVAGLTGLHTSLIFIVAAYCLLVMLAVLVRVEPIAWRLAAPHLIGAVALGGALVLVLVWPALAAASGVSAFRWPSEASVAEGFGQMMTFTPMSDFPQWWIGIPALVGVFLLVKHRRMVWMTGAFLFLGGLYAATVSMETPLVHLLTGPFYNDHWRIAALIPLAGAVGFGEFTSTAAENIGRWLRQWLTPWPLRPVATVSAISVVLAAAVLGDGAYLDRNIARVAGGYRDGPTISSGERAAIAWLKPRVGPGERVMNGRKDGTVWMYALAGIEPVEWLFYHTPENIPAYLLSRHLDELGEDGPVRAALNELNVRYVILGEGFLRVEDERAPGLRGLASNPYFHPVYRNPDAVIYEIEGQQTEPTSRASGG